MDRGAASLLQFRLAKKADRGFAAGGLALLGATRIPPPCIKRVHLTLRYDARRRSDAPYHQHLRHRDACRRLASLVAGIEASPPVAGAKVGGPFRSQTYCYHGEPRASTGGHRLRMVSLAEKVAQIGAKYSHKQIERWHYQQKISEDGQAKNQGSKLGFARVLPVVITNKHIRNEAFVFSSIFSNVG
jgi:hypothetical protein